jgi:HlyD family secretion protein
MKSRLKYLFTLALPVAGLAIATLWVPKIARWGNAAVTYETTSASIGPIRRIVTTSGPVRALVTVQVGSQLSGQIQKVNADFNTEVKEGDVLAALDAKTFEAKVAQARADLLAARAQLANQEAALTKSEAVLRQAERATERQQALAERGVATQAALETATRDAEVARADITVAKSGIENAKAVIAQRQAALDQAQIDLDRTTIRSPINGTVISRTVDVGQTVAASLQAPELFRIAQDLRRIQIEAQVNEADVGSVAEGNSVTFTVDAYPERKFEGRVSQVRLAATELQNVVTYTVIIEAHNEDRRLFPGMTANAQIVTAEKDGVLRLPNDALRFKPRDRGTAQAAPKDAAKRGERLVAQLKGELRLTDEQAGIVREEVRKAAEARSREQSTPVGFGAPQPTRPGAGDSGDARSGFMMRIEQIVAPLLSAEQRPLFERWKREREASRMATIWVLGPEGELDDRQIRLGIADDQFTEVLGNRALKTSDLIVTRMREAK